MAALVSPALAQTSFTDGAALATRAVDAAKELRTHLAELAKAGARPDFSKPPASELFGRIYDMNALAALPPPAPNEISWLLNWSAAGGGIVKAILTFGITPPAGPSDQAAIERNLVDYEDQQAVASSFLIRITAREMQVLSLFMAQLPEDQRTPIRQEGFDTARAGATKVLSGALITLASDLKTANARMLSAAIRDTGDVWVQNLFAKDRPEIMREIGLRRKKLRTGRRKRISPRSAPRRRRRSSGSPSPPSWRAWTPVQNHADGDLSAAAEKYFDDEGVSFCNNRSPGDDNDTFVTRSRSFRLARLRRKTRARAKSGVVPL
jgi:hypothetical protein